MSLIKKIALSVIFFFILAIGIASAQVPKNIIVSLETGNAKLLSGHFNQNVELVVLENDNVYSKAQAQQIVNNFFNSFKPIKENAFSVIHNSGKEGARFVIGKLITVKGNFRVSFLLKKNGQKEYIHQLRIEKQ